MQRRASCLGLNRYRGSSGTGQPSVQDVAVEVVAFRAAAGFEEAQVRDVEELIDSMMNIGSRFFNINKAVGEDVALFLGYEPQTRYVRTVFSAVIWS